MDQARDAANAGAPVFDGGALRPDAPVSGGAVVVPPACLGAARPTLSAGAPGRRVRPRSARSLAVPSPGAGDDMDALMKMRSSKPAPTSMVQHLPTIAGGLLGGLLGGLIGFFVGGADGRAAAAFRHRASRASAPWAASTSATSSSTIASPGREMVENEAVTLVDSFGRTFHYLRLSVEDACDYRCRYCLPHGYKSEEPEPPLSVDEIRCLTPRSR